MKRITQLVFATLAAFALFACSTAPTTPQQSIYQLESNYNAAAQIVLAYKALPTCGGVATTVLCSKPEVIAQLKQADNVAYSALVAAENTVRTQGAGANANTAMVAAQQAIQALTAISAALQVK